MTKTPNYPKYIKYGGHRKPSVLLQEYFVPNEFEIKKYYPDNLKLNKYFKTEAEKETFGASEFCNFLDDTIAVEHKLVIRAISEIDMIGYEVPKDVKEDLFKTATDEAFHAEQSLKFQHALEHYFNFLRLRKEVNPLFLRRLESLIYETKGELNESLLRIINAIVTETRISIELSLFAIDDSLSDLVRNICLSHAKDESVHASQFKSLGKWLWNKMNDEEKAKTSNYYVKSAISRSLPDLKNILSSFITATGMHHREALSIILKEYSIDVAIKEMLTAARPTFKFLENLGIEEYVSIDQILDAERVNIETEIESLKI